MPFTTVFPLKVLKKTFFSPWQPMFGFQRSDPIDHGVFMVFILYTSAFHFWFLKRKKIKVSPLQPMMNL